MILTQMHSYKELETENASLKDELCSSREKIQKLQEELDWFKKQIFGKKSEKIVEQNPLQLLLPGFEEYCAANPIKKEEKKQTVEAHSRKIPKRHGDNKLNFPDDLPKEQIVLDVPEEEKVCSKTGKPLVKIGEEITHKLALKPGCYYIKEFIRPKYALPNQEGILVESMPDSFIPKCQVDESVLADVLTKKFADHLPLYRISDILARDDVKITRQLLSQWVLKCGQNFKPLYDEMVKLILESGNVFMDETPISMQLKGNGKVHQAYMWVMSGGKAQDPPYRVYHFKLNRQHENAVNLLKNYTGVLHSDKYGAYVTLAQEKRIIWCPCWGHIRRKFVEAEFGDPKFRELVLRKIRHLFMLERVAWARSPEERLKIRQEKSVPIIDDLITLIKNRMVNGKMLPKSKFKTALGYFYSLIPYLKNYTNHPFARLDNNVAERAIRPLAIGRKNWLFMGSQDGGEAAAVIISLVQTCRALGIDPRVYLEDVMRRIMGHPFNKIRELLPDQWVSKNIKI